MFATKPAALAGALLLAAAVSPGFAQTAPSTTSPSGSSGSSASGQSGVTSGPASDTPTTLGTSGATTATPHQQQGVKDQSSAVTREQEQGVGSGSSQAPHGPAVGQPGLEGGKSGSAPKRSGNSTE